MRNRIQWHSICVILLMIPGFFNQVSAKVIDKIVAIVNSDIITLVELNNESAPYLSRIEQGDYTQEQKSEMIRQVHEKVLNLLIDQSLTQQEANRYNISVSEIDIDAAIENFIAAKSIHLENLDRMLAQEGLTMETWRESFKKQILQSKLINHAVRSKVVITESEIEAYYNDHLDDFAGIRKYHLRNILSTDKNQIEEIYKKLEQNIKFTTLAKKYSMAPNASDGGDLGVFDITSFSEEIKSKISDLKKGKFTGIISTAQGFQIFFVQDIISEGDKTLEQAHDEIYDRLYMEQVEIKFKTWLKSLKEKAHIEIKL